MQEAKTQHHFLRHQALLNREQGQLGTPTDTQLLQLGIKLYLSSSIYYPPVCDLIPIPTPGWAPLDPYSRLRKNHNKTKMVMFYQTKIPITY